MCLQTGRGRALKTTPTVFSLEKIKVGTKFQGGIVYHDLLCACLICVVDHFAFHSDELIQLRFRDFIETLSCGCHFFHFTHKCIFCSRVWRNTRNILNTKRPATHHPVLTLRRIHQFLVNSRWCCVDRKVHFPKCGRYAERHLRPVRNSLRGPSEK